MKAPASWVPTPGRGGLLSSRERCFNLGEWDIVAVPVKAVLVESVPTETVSNARGVRAASNVLAHLNARSRASSWCVRWRLAAQVGAQGRGQWATAISTVMSLRALTDLTSRSSWPTSHPDQTTESTTSPRTTASGATTERCPATVRLANR